MKLLTKSVLASGDTASPCGARPTSMRKISQSSCALTIATSRLVSSAVNMYTPRSSNATALATPELSKSSRAA
jgi:hypothetical protein